MANTCPVLTEEQVAEYYREGYLVVPALVPHAAIDSVLAVSPTTGENGRWTPVVFDHANPTANAALHRLLVEPSVVAAVESLFEAPARVYYGMFAVVPANGGHGLPWHQDNQYNQVLGNALNVFIALCDITLDKANLWVAPRSHLAGVQPSKKNETTAPNHREAIVEPENGILLPALKKGDACIFDRSMYHRTLRNETGEPRYAYAAQYMADYSRMAATGSKDPLKMLAGDLAKQMERVLGRV